MSETRDVEGLTPERVEALLRKLRYPCDHKRQLCEDIGCEGPVMREAAATIAELWAEVERWKRQGQATSELCRERGEALERKDAALRRIVESKWTIEEFRAACDDETDCVFKVIARRALAPVADQTGETCRCGAPLDDEGLCTKIHRQPATTEDQTGGDDA